MKKTFTINISGTVFHIDDDAHEKLNNYLNKLTRYFGNDPDAKEIVQDIESRIAELFSQKLKGGSEVITIDHVEEIIQVMGMPESFSETKEEKEEASKTIITRTRGKKLYRDPDNRVLGGVCGGLGAYFNIDPVAIRLIFVVLCTPFLRIFVPMGSGVLVYLVLWIVVPKARSIAQRLEMRGKEANVNNISKSFREDFQDINQNSRENMEYIQGRERSPLLKILLIIALVIFSPFLLIIFIVALIPLIVSLFVGGHVIGHFPHGLHHIFETSPWDFEFPHHLNFLVSSDILTWFWIGLALVVGIPLIMLAYSVLKLIFRFKTKRRTVGLVSLVLWIVGLTILIGATISGVNDFKSTATRSKEESFSTRADTLYLKLGADEFSNYSDSEFDLEGLKVASLNDQEFLVGTPRFTIEKSEDNNFSIIIKSKAKGKDLNKAQGNAREVIYKYNQQDSLISFQPCFMIPSQSSWHSQEVNILLKVPVNKTVYLSNDLVKIIHDIKNKSNTWDGDMVGKYWTMKPDGLEMAQRKPAQLQINKKPKK